MKEIKKFKKKGEIIPGEEEKSLSPDIVFLWGNWIVAILQSILFFKNMFKMPTHIQIRYNKTMDFSAETSGVKLVPHKDIKKNRRAEVYKAPLVLTGNKLKKFYKLCQGFMGYKYDFYIYFRWHLHVSIAYVPLFLIIGLGFKLYNFKTMIFYLAGYVVFALIAKLILKCLSKKTWHCTELASTVYKEIGVDFGWVSNEKSAPYLNLLMVRFAKWPQLFVYKKP